MRAIGAYGVLGSVALVQPGGKATEPLITSWWLVPSLCVTGDSQDKTCLKQSTPARDFALNMLSISGTFLNQPMVIDHFPPYE
jgi:hypothetical protein